MKYRYGLLVSLLVCSSAWADDSLVKIQAEVGFAKIKSLCGQFSQDRKLVSVATPVHSSGHFCVDRNSISWITDSPSASTLTMDLNKLVKVQGGTVVKELNSTDPVFKIATGILPAILNGDAAPLTKSYDFVGTINGDHWYATFTPREPVLVKATGTIKLEGDKYIRKVSMSPGTGDQTVIYLTNLVPVFIS